MDADELESLKPGQRLWTCFATDMNDNVKVMWPFFVIYKSRMHDGSLWVQFDGVISSDFFCDIYNPEELFLTLDGARRRFIDEKEAEIQAAEAWANKARQLAVEPEFLFVKQIDAMTPILADNIKDPVFRKAVGIDENGNFPPFVEE